MCIWQILISIRNMPGEFNQTCVIEPSPHSEYKNLVFNVTKSYKHVKIYTCLYECLLKAYSKCYVFTLFQSFFWFTLHCSIHNMYT